MNIIIFPILAFKESDKACEGGFNRGTGYLINKEGYFYTAGHNYFLKERGKNPERLNCFALINGQLINLKDLFIEYEDNDFTKKDFAFGRIDIDINNVDCSFIINNEETFLIGYSTRDLPYDIIKKINFKEATFNLYKIKISPTENKKKICGIDVSYDNILFFDYDPVEDLYGLSGCPVIEKDKLRGLLVSNCFIINEYLEMTFNKYK